MSVNYRSAAHIGAESHHYYRQLLAPTGVDRFFWATDEHILYRDTGAAWVKASVADHPDIDGAGPDDHHNKSHADTDHTAGFAAPTGGIDIGDAAAEGAGATHSRSDHQHQFSAPSAGYPLDVAAAKADGAATTPARSDHVHAHGSGYSPDAHHARSHDHSQAADGDTLTPATFNIPFAVTPAQTAEGEAVWDSDGDRLTVGTGAGRKTLVNGEDAPAGELGGTYDAPTVDATHSGSAHHNQVAGGNALTLTGDTLDFDGGAAPGGELGGTWAVPAVDATHSGSAHHAQDHGSADHSGAVLPGETNESFGAFYADMAEIVAPANPAASTRRVFVDSSDGKLKVRTSGGASVSLEEQGGGVTFGPPSGNIDIGDAQVEGVSGNATRADHQHVFTAPSAGYPLDVAAAEADGAATTPARSDHVHAHGSGYSPDAHHARSHDHSQAADGDTLTPATFNIPFAVTPAQTAEGQAVWDSDGDRLTVGNGSGRKTLVNGEDAPAGELGGTYDAPTVDATHSGSAHHNEDHAARHADGGADELAVQDLASDAATDGQVAKADGAGAVAFEDDTVVINFIIDGGGSAITAGSKGYVEIPFAIEIEGWTILGDQSGSIVVDVNRSTYAGFPTLTSIAGTELPTLSSAQKNQDLTLATWTTTIAAGDVLEFEVDSVATVQRVTVAIRGRKT